MSTYQLRVFLFSILQLALLLTQTWTQSMDDSVDLLFGLRVNISKLNLGDNSSTVLKSSTNMNVLGLDVDVRSKRIFYSDVAAKTLHSAYIVGNSITRVETLVGNITNQDGVAWDWVNEKLYWVTAGSSTDNSTIEVMDMKTGRRKLLDSYHDGTQARGIVLDPINGWLFWSDYNQTTAKIVRMSMDGSESKILISRQDLINGQRSLQFANGLTYDYRTETLFWIDAGTGVIGSIKADGTQPSIHVNLNMHFTQSHGFNLEFFGGDFYFSDWKNNDIRKISSANTSSEDKGVLKKFRRDPTTIRVVHPDRQPLRQSGNPCNNIKCGQEGICLLSAANPRGYSCVCPDGVDPTLCSETNNCAPNGCQNGGTCVTNNITSSGFCRCTEGFTGDDCSSTLSGTILTGTTQTPAPAPKASSPMASSPMPSSPTTPGSRPSADAGDFSVSGSIFLGVVGSLLGVIILLTLIIAMIVCLTLRSGFCRNGKCRTHSIGGLSDRSNESPTHVVVRGLSDHDYISIKSRDSPAPKGGIIINIEAPNTTSLNQYSVHKAPLPVSDKEETVIEGKSKSCEIICDSTNIASDNQSNEEGDEEYPKVMLERSLKSLVATEDQFNSLNRRSESLL